MLCKARFWNIFLFSGTQMDGPLLLLSSSSSFWNLGLNPRRTMSVNGLCGVPHGFLVLRQKWRTSKWVVDCSGVWILIPVWLPLCLPSHIYYRASVTHSHHPSPWPMLFSLIHPILSSPFSIWHLLLVLDLFLHPPVLFHPTWLSLMLFVWTSNY